MIFNILQEKDGMAMNDCLLGELMLCEKLGIKGQDIMFTSTTPLCKNIAKPLKWEHAIVNLGDFSQIDDGKNVMLEII